MRGLRIRQRMREQYGTATTSELASSRLDDEGGDQDDGGGGGFLTGVGDVVQPYNLPRPTHVVFASPPRSPEPDGHTPDSALALPVLDNDVAEIEDAGEGNNAGPPENSYSDERPADKLASHGQGHGENRCTPKSMAQLAAEAETAVTAQVSKGLRGLGQGEAEVGEGQEGADSVVPPRRRAPPRARPKANEEAKVERLRGRKRVHAREGETEDEGERVGDAQPGGSGTEEDVVGKDGRPRNAKRARPRPRRDRRTVLAVPVPVPTSDRVLRARKQ